MLRFNLRRFWFYILEFGLLYNIRDRFMRFIHNRLRYFNSFLYCLWVLIHLLKFYQHFLCNFLLFKLTNLSICCYDGFAWVTEVDVFCRYASIEGYKLHMLLKGSWHVTLLLQLFLFALMALETVSICISRDKLFQKPGDIFFAFNNIFFFALDLCLFINLILNIQRSINFLFQFGSLEFFCLGLSSLRVYRHLNRSWYWSNFSAKRSELFAQYLSRHIEWLK